MAPTPALSEPKPSRWRYLFITLGAVQVLGVVGYLAVIALAVQQAQVGVSGTEFIGILLEVMVLPVIGLVALVNLISLPIFLLRTRPRGKTLSLSVASLVVSFLLVGYAGYAAYQTYILLPLQQKASEQEFAEHMAQEQRQFDEDNAKPEITKDEAIQLLRSCQIQGFYYTAQTDKSNGGWGELSSTGVVLTKINGKPYRISIADRLIPELVPVAREAQKSCDGPQFWHDGNYEQKQADGSWR